MTLDEIIKSKIREAEKAEAKKIRKKRLEKFLCLFRGHDTRWYGRLKYAYVYPVIAPEAGECRKCGAVVLRW